MSEGNRDRKTMEGMISKANTVLRRALDPSTIGAPKNLCEKCKGVVLLSAIEAGFIVTGNVGSGILLAKRSDGTWSVPSAVGMTGIGWGFVGGGSIKDIIIFIMDQSTLEALAGEAGLKLGMQAEFTLANFGRSYTGSVYFNTSAAGKTVSIAFSKGFFGGISFEGAVVGTRKALNQAFYDSNIGALELIMGRDVAMPEGTMIDDVYKKLDMVKKGKRADEHREG